MNQATKRENVRALGGWLVCGVLFCVPMCLPSARAASDDALAADQKSAVVPSATHRARSGTLEDRVETFSKAFALDAAQRAQLRKILLQQRDAVRNIWRDRSLSPIERVPATLAANERIGDEIRSILNDEQKRQYNPPKPSALPEPGERRSVEQWLDTPRPR
jgi:hypothetical protein